MNTEFPPEANDDDAERAQHRRSSARSSTQSNVTLSNERLDEEQQGMKKCLEIFHENKISKANAWQLTLIDNMANLCRGHHKSLRNFQIVGSSLEATTKIYGLRVDSVHSDIVRMSSGLGRMKAGPIRRDDDDADNDADGRNDLDGNNVSNADGEPSRSKTPVKRKRARKQMCTITKNKDTLNGRPELMQTPDALFYKLNSIMGETSSSNKLILNILETRSSELSVTMSQRFWDNRISEPIQFVDDDNYDTDNITYSELPMKPHIQPRCTLRQQMVGYAISNTPIDDNEDEEMPEMVDPSFNISQYEYAFDMAADIEPIPPIDTSAIDYDNLDYDGGNEFDDLTQDDRDAISACKGLRRKATPITDMRPFDGSKLEYSYRPLDNINQFWAGPSYWKFRPSARRLATDRPPFADAGSQRSSRSTSATVSTVKRKASSRNKIAVVRFTSQSSVSDKNRRETFDSDDSDTFISVDSNAAQKFRKTNVYKRWDSKRLKLPTDLQVDHGLFNFYSYCPSAVMQKEAVENATPANDDDISDSDHNDIEPLDNGEILMEHHMDIDDDIVMDHMNEVPEIDTNVPHTPMCSQETASQSTQAEVISQIYEGAPPEIKRIEVQFARRAKVIDMKQMKSVCHNMIKKQCEKTSNRTFTHPNARADEKYKDGASSFGVLFHSLPHLLSRMNAENLSPSIAFYTVLHLANEHRFRLYKSKEDDTNVFLIRQLEE